MKKQNISNRIWLLAIFILLFASCTKIEYTQIAEPAYLRVFNNVNYLQTMGSKDDKVPYFCMLINPKIGSDGKFTGAEIIGDFLDKRDPYAPPYPSHIGNSTDPSNPEYPGKENVLVGPILNGFDLSSWAQVPSGEVRVVFAYRPKNTVPFFELEDRLKNDILIDTVINLQSKEVYTLHLLQTDFIKKDHGILLRHENFYKLPLSDSLVYVNFYNMSAKGFWEADASLKDDDYRLKSFKNGVKDEMNVFLSLYESQEELSHYAAKVNGYQGRFLTTVKRNTSSNEVNAYASFPLWASSKSNGIRTAIWQRFDFFTLGMDPVTNPFYDSDTNTGSNWAVLNCLLNGKVGLTSNENGTLLPNLLVNVHSGKDNPRTFATINTIEIVNGRVYLTTIQRKYAPPIY
ncbi:hypothetical protein [Sphingobacterium paramultivorum]|uniref:hypothetical protein n=1 Tax=Sphingobacterium paramultivorum TaxID=2886510 RepID=UPI00129CB576|nr:hypothetical protein [Sphingobacterium paramultivorum]